MAGRVFISHPRDGGAGQAWAERIQAGLERRGFQCFRDETGIEAGGDWPAQVEQALSDSDALVYVLGRGTAQSRWMRRELLHALEAEGGRLVVPVRVEAGVPVPVEIADIQPIDLTDETDDPVDILAARLRAGNARKNGVRPCFATPKR